MANTVKGITIEIEGKTSGLTKSLKDVDIQLASTNKALREVDKALSLDPKNVELLATKEALLAQKTELTTDRLEILKQVQKDALDKLPEDSAETTAKMAILQSEIATTEKNLDGMSDNSAEASKEVKDLGDSSKKAGDKAKDSSEKFQKFGEVMAKTAQVAAAAIAAMTAGMVAASKALADCTKGAAAFADEIITTSQVTGIATDDLQGYKYAAELVDVSLETLTGSMAKNIKSMSAVQNGQKAMSAAYDALGVSATDASGNLRDSETVYWELIDALGDIDDETQRDALAMQIFGKSAQDLNPLINAGSQAMKDYKKEAEDVGYVMSGDTLKSFGEFDDTMQRLELGTTAAKNALGTVLLPILTQLGTEGTSLLAQFTNGLNSTDGDIASMASVIETMMPQILSTIQTYLPQVLSLAGSILEVLIQGIVATLPTLIPVASDIILTLVNSLIDVLPELIPVAIDTVLTLVEALLDPGTLEKLMSAAVQIVSTLADSLSRRLPTLIGIAYQAIITLQSSLIKNIPQIIVAAVKIIGALALGIVQNLPLIISKGPEILKAFLTAIKDIPGEFSRLASNWGKDMIGSFVSGIKKNVGKLKDSLKSVAELIKSYLHFTSPDVGPLAHDLIGKSGKDMIDTFARGMESELGTLKSSLASVGSVIAGGVTSTDYSSQLGLISSQLGSIGGSDIVIPVSIGGKKIDTIIVNAQNKMNYRNGARM